MGPMLTKCTIMGVSYEGEISSVSFTLSVGVGHPLRLLVCGGGDGSETDTHTHIRWAAGELDDFAEPSVAGVEHV